MIRRHARDLSTTAILLLIAFLGVAGCDSSSGTSEDPVTGDLITPCTPGAQVCYEGSVATCAASGAAWVIEDCEEGAVCADGACGAPPCEPGERLCSESSVLVCQDDGVSLVEEPCDEGLVCFAGACLECVNDDQCEDTQACMEGACTQPPLSIAAELPPGQVGVPYSETLMADGGAAPYSWAHTNGLLPDGLTLSASGELSGTPTAAGDSRFEVEASDANANTASESLDLTIIGPGMAITTDTLPVGLEGFDYSAPLEAMGGQPPYAWGISSGAPPLGVSLTSDGVFTGIPTEIGDFTMNVKVFDDGIPPSFAQKELTLTIDIAPLEIIGDQSFDVLLTKIIVLPLIVVTDGFPFPYSAQLEARGGLKPYSWVETPIPSELSFLIPTGGLPDGLTLASDGSISGGVSDPSQVVTVEIPFSDIELTGFFFMGEVSDAQSPAETESAVFLIPTVPL